MANSIHDPVQQALAAAKGAAGQDYPVHQRRRRLLWTAWIALALCFGLVTTALAYTEDQAKKGAAVFAFYCSTCHGDRGQGLTDEFRATWDPSDQNCWVPKCHGPNHPDGGFILPRYVPAVIGPGTLSDMADAQSLYKFISTRMPYQDPSLLSEEQHLQVTAFLLSEHDVVADGTELNATTMASIRLRPEAPSAPPAAPQSPPAEQKMPLTPASASPRAPWPWIIVGAVLLGGGLVALSYLALSGRFGRSSH